MMEPVGMVKWSSHSVSPSTLFSYVSNIYSSVEVFVVFFILLDVSRSLRLSVTPYVWKLGAIPPP
jgi:hypothetical protein